MSAVHLLTSGIIEPNTSKIKKALNDGVIIEQVKYINHPIIHYAFKFIDEGEPLNILINRLDINHIYEDGMTALHYAVICNRPTIVKKLLDKGANSSIIANKKSAL